MSRLRSCTTVQIFSMLPNELQTTTFATLSTLTPASMRSSILGCTAFASKLKNPCTSLRETSKVEYLNWYRYDGQRT